MSSPVHDEFGGRSAYFPPRSRDNDRAAAVLEAAERIKVQSGRAFSPREEPPQADPGVSPGVASQEYQYAYAAQRGDGNLEAAMGEIVRANWRTSSLEPVTMPPPPRTGLGPSWGMITRVCGAVGFASAVALFVAGGLPLSSITTPLSADRQANAAAVAAAPPIEQPPTNKPAVEVRGAPLRSAAVSTSTLNETDQRIIGISPASAATTAVGVVAGTSPSSNRSEVAPAVSPPAMSSPVPAPAMRALTREEIEPLVRRGRELVAEGDIAAGRLLLTRAAEAGDGQAAHALAGTYDAIVLGKLKVIGVVPDDHLARLWYEKAAALGVSEAGRRLEQLAEHRR
jgi:hypothetical protein